MRTRRPITARRAIAALLALVIALGVAPALAGCSVQTLVKNVTGGNVDLGGDKVPADFPKAVPLYDGTVVLGASVGSGDGKVWNVTIKVSGADAYKKIGDQLTGAGFAGEFGSQAPDGGGTGTFASDAYGVLVVVTNAGSNGWVANYSVSKAGVTTPTPSAPAGPDPATPSASATSSGG